MKALAPIQYGLNDVRIESIDYPQIGSREVLVKVESAGLCKTDIKKIHEAIPEPKVWGHEMAGVIQEVGKDVTDWKTGDRVVAHHKVPCLDCHYCWRQDYSMCNTFINQSSHAGNYGGGGGYAQYVIIPELGVKHGLVRMPAHVSFDEGCQVEIVNCCWRGISESGVKSNDTVLVVGQGPVGLTHTQLLKKLVNANVIATDHHEYRLQASKRYGADHVFNSNEENVADFVKQKTNGIGADLAIVAFESTNAIKSALSAIRRGGRVMIFGGAHGVKEMQVDADWMYRNEIMLYSNYSCSHAFKDASADIVFNRKIDLQTLITHRFGLKDFMKAVDLASHPKDSLRIIIHPQA